MPYSAPDTISLVLNAAFNKGFEAAPTWHQKVTEPVTATGTETLFAWLDRIPALRKWEGNRIANFAAMRTYGVKTDKFELTEYIDRVISDDNQLRIFDGIISGMGTAALKWPDLTVAKMIKANPLCFDGVPMFSNNHPVNLDNAGLGVYSNDVSDATAAGAYQKAQEAGYAILGADGQPTAFNGTHVLAPTNLKYAFKSVLNTQFGVVAGTGGNTNIFEGDAELVLAPELKLNNEEQAVVGAGKKYAYLLDLSQGLFPFAWLLRNAPEFQNLGTLGAYDPDTDMYKYGVRSRGAAAPTMPFLAVRMLIG